MKRILIIIAGLFSIAYGQRYQTMPAEGYGPIKRMRVDSVLNIPIGDTTRKRNLSDGKDSGQIRWFNGSLYVYNGAYWSGVSGGGSGTTPNLQDVTNEGNTTTSGLTITSPTEGLNIFNGSENIAAIYGTGTEGRVRFGTSSTVYSELSTRATTGRNIKFPDSSGTVVLTQLLADTAAAIRSSIENYGTFLGDRVINGAGYNFTIDSTYTSQIISSGSGTTDKGYLYLNAPEGVGAQLNYQTDSGTATVAVDPTSVVLSYNSATTISLSANEKLRIKVAGNIPAAGYVLTSSDTYGTATWQPDTDADTTSLSNRIDTKASLSGASFTGPVSITTTSGGLLIPRMTTTQRDAISSPATNLIVNNTTTGTIDQYSGSAWYSIAGDVDVFLRAAQAMGSPIKAGPMYHITQLNTGTALTSTRSYFNAVYVEKPITITGAAFYQATQGNFTGNNYNGIALYSYSGGTVTLIDSTARNENIWKGTSGTWQQAAFAGGSRTLQPGLYYLLFLYSSSAQTTAPVVGNTTAGTGNYLAPLTTNSARFYGGVITSVTSPPTSQACSAWTNITTYYGAFLY